MDDMILGGTFEICFVTWNVVSFFSLLKLIHFEMKDNCFTILLWFLPYINMN